MSGHALRNVRPISRVRFWRNGQLNTGFGTLCVRFTRNGRTNIRIRIPHVRFTRIGHSCDLRCSKPDYPRNRANSSVGHPNRRGHTIRISSQVHASRTPTACRRANVAHDQIIQRHAEHVAKHQQLVHFGVCLLGLPFRNCLPGNAQQHCQLFLRHVARTAQILQILFKTHVRPFVEFPYRLDLRLLAIAKQQLVINVAFHATIFRLHCDSQPNFATQPTVARREVDFTGLLRQ